MSIINEANFLRIKFIKDKLGGWIVSQNFSCLFVVKGVKSMSDFQSMCFTFLSDFSERYLHWGQK